MPKRQPQRDLFSVGPSRPSVDARRSMPKRPLAVEPFAFEVGEEAEPRGLALVPEWLRLPTDGDA